MNGMDDNVPDVCKRCGYIISPEENAPEDICEKCQQKTMEEIRRRVQSWKANGYDGEDMPSRSLAMRYCELLCAENEKLQAIVDASVQMYRFNEESRKVFSTAVSPTHKTIIIRERTEQENDNYRAWEEAVKAWAGH